MPSYTIYPTGTSDQRVYSVDTVYANARQGASTLAANPTEGEIYVGQFISGATYYVQQGAFGPFDTSAIIGNIQSAELSLNVSSISASLNKWYELREYNWPAGTGSFVPGSQLGTKPLVATKAVSALGRQSWVASAYALPITSALKLHLSAEEQRSNVTPTGVHQFSASAADAAGTTNDPYLAITTVTAVGRSFVPAMIGG